MSKEAYPEELFIKLAEIGYTNSPHDGADTHFRVHTNPLDVYVGAEPVELKVYKLVGTVKVSLTMSREDR